MKRAKDPEIERVAEIYRSLPASDRDLLLSLVQILADKGDPTALIVGRLGLEAAAPILALIGRA